MILIWGMKDVALLSEMAHESMAFCKQGRLITFPDASHWIQHEEADQVNALIAEFIGNP
jgi:pimeloyl-ACP methyl ester carboxylesterase